METPPAFCHQCGTSYPWKKVAVDAAKALADELDCLSVDEQEALKQSLDDLVSSTPRTEVAVVRVKKLLKKAGTEGYSAFREILIGVLSETAKKSLFG